MVIKGNTDGLLENERPLYMSCPRGRPGGESEENFDGLLVVPHVSFGV